MSIYAVFLNEPDKSAWNRLKAEWPKPRHFIVTDQLAFIAPKKGATTEDVGDIVGMNEDHTVSGIVTKVNFSTINGWNRQAVWQWLEDNQ